MTVAFEYFMNRDVSAWNWRKIPKTKTRTDVESVFMTFTRWIFERASHFEYDEWGIETKRCQLKKTNDDFSVITYKGHLVVQAFQNRHGALFEDQRE